MTTNKQLYKTVIRKILLTIALLAALLTLFLLLTAPLVNNNIANKTANSLVNLPLPSQTEYIENVYKAGKLVGNGNGMQYFGAILIHSELSLEKLKAYYSNYAENDWECLVEQQTDSAITILEHAQLAFETDIDDNNYFIVYSWGTNNSIFHEFDIRGH